MQALLQSVIDIENSIEESRTPGVELVAATVASIAFVGLKWLLLHSVLKDIFQSGLEAMQRVLAIGAIDHLIATKHLASSDWIIRRIPAVALFPELIGDLSTLKQCFHPSKNTLGLLDPWITSYLLQATLIRQDSSGDGCAVLDAWSELLASILFWKTSTLHEWRAQFPDNAELDCLDKASASLRSIVTEARDDGAINEKVQGLIMSALVLSVQDARRRCDWLSDSVTTQSLSANFVAQLSAADPAARQELARGFLINVAWSSVSASDASVQCLADICAISLDVVKLLCAVGWSAFLIGFFLTFDFRTYLARYYSGT